METLTVVSFGVLVVVLWKLNTVQGQLEALRKRIEKGSPLTDAEEEGAPVTRTAETGRSVP